MDSDWERGLDAASATLRRYGLEAASQSIPVSVSWLLDHFRVGAIVYESDGSPTGGELRVIDGEPHPVLFAEPTSNASLSVRDRFTVAHEIAHAIVDREVRIRPQSDRQYWQLERLCQQFANTVLLPEVWVRSVYSRVRGAKDLCRLIPAVALSAEVSREAAARRLVFLRSGQAAWAIRPQESGAESAVDWRWENPEAWWGLERGQHLPTEHPFSLCFSGLRRHWEAREPVAIDFDVDGVPCHGRLLKYELALITSRLDDGALDSGHPHLDEVHFNE
jgi:Zn-dependent peptidase ImmA (M78 family)